MLKAQDQVPCPGTIGSGPRARDGTYFGFAGLPKAMDPLWPAKPTPGQVHAPWHSPSSPREQGSSALAPPSLALPWAAGTVPLSLALAWPWTQHLSVEQAHACAVAWGVGWTVHDVFPTTPLTNAAQIAIPLRGDEMSFSCAVGVTQD